MNGIFDSHAHYDDKRFDKDRDLLINSFSSFGVIGIINVGCDIDSSIKSVKLSNKYPIFYCSVGIHPHESKNVDEDYIDRLENLAQNNKVVAIGEMGLDYHYNNSAVNVQKRVFIEQLKLAEKLDLPVIIHSRDAFDDTVEILKDFPKIRGVVHCFCYDKDSAIKFVDMGFYIGITGAVTFKSANNIRQAIQSVGVDNILLETDCPYMAPEPYRGKRCDSSMIKYSALKISEITSLDCDKIINITRENCCKLFKIKTD